jgi:DNA polymerase I-like protein with 3'-5' exonuclease and polymerase domains
VNFAGIYGAAPPKIALTTGMSLSEAQKLHKTYWERNKAVKLVAKATQVKTIGDQMWLYNPVSKFWYSLRADKDRFSTLNQSSGVYCFDLYIRFVREQGIKIQMQIHDEIAFPLLVNEQEKVKIKLNKAIQKVNEIVKLNVPLGISMDFGIRYSEIH